LQGNPFARDSPRDAPVEAGRERARLVIVGAAVIGADHSRETRAFLNQFVHAWMRGNPHQHLVPVAGQPRSKIVEEDFPTAPRARAAADQEDFHRRCATKELSASRAIFKKPLDPERKATVAANVPPAVLTGKPAAEPAWAPQPRQKARCCGHFGRLLRSLQGA